MSGPRTSPNVQLMRQIGNPGSQRAGEPIVLTPMEAGTMADRLVTEAFAAGQTHGYNAAQAEAAELIRTANRAAADLAELAVDLTSVDEKRAGRLLDIATTLRQAVEA